MELKSYQQQALQDLKQYLAYINLYKDYAKAFTQVWADKHVTLGANKPIKPYKNVIPHVPHVCFKIPTGGGKTFVACASVKPIFDALTNTSVKALVWLVPSEAILSQTIKCLKDADHPYRQRLDRDFAGKVAVYTKEEAMNGQGLNPSTVRDQLSVFVLSYDSFRTSKKEGRKAYRQNGSLYSFKDNTVYPGYHIEYSEGEEEPSLSAVIKSLEPVVIVDESHHAQTNLSIDMLKGFNPMFVLDLTATPRTNSNIISVVESYKLKLEQMVKLPVIVSNHKGQGAVLDAAIKMQALLEHIAKEEEKVTGTYIRPIVLLQAESKNNADSTTYEKIKQKLIDGGIPAEQIAIKTSEVNELKVKGKDVDLLSRKCQIRYIITVNALKEGWDCPFAYVLATIANRNSVVDVEQIVGRILRQPYAREHKNKFLNMSYVFTNSSDFERTLNKVIDGLQNAGFSKKDYRVAGDDSAVSEGSTGTNRMNSLFGENEGHLISGSETTQSTQTPETNPANDETSSDKNDDFQELFNIQTDKKPFVAPVFTQNSESQSTGTYPEVASLSGLFLKVAEAQATYGKNVAEQAKTNIDAPAEAIEDKDLVKIRDQYLSDMDTFRLPQFYYRTPKSLFDTGGVAKVTKEYLAKNFKLGMQNVEIDFENLENQIYKFDLEQGDEEPKRCKMSVRDATAFRNALKLFPPEGRKRQMKAKIIDEISGSYNTLAQSEIKTFVDRIVDTMDSDRLADMEENFLSYSEKIKAKVKELLESYYEKNFNQLLTIQEIFVDFSFEYQDKAIVPDNKSIWPKMLYSGEGKMNSFETKIIEEVCGMDNILWWHRNSDNPHDKNAYCINGFVNHYPDFIICTKNKHIIAVETKGEHLNNPDQLAKARLGKLLDDNDNNPLFSYFMVFEKEKENAPGCVSKAEFFKILENW